MCKKKQQRQRLNTHISAVLERALTVIGREKIQQKFNKVFISVIFFALLLTSLDIFLVIFQLKKFSIFFLLKTKKFSQIHNTTKKKVFRQK
jgi:hypothetical protein